MPIRLFAAVLLLAVATARAAPPDKPPSPPKDTPAEIDVDAMARAKDADASTKPPADAATGTTPAPSTDASTTDAESAHDSAIAPTTDPAAPAAADAAPANAEAADASSVPLSPLAPASPPDAAERRVAAGCESRAKSLLDAAQKGDYATATRDFDAKMRSALPTPKFRQAWESLAQFGVLQARGQSHPGKGEGYYVVTVPLIFEKANLYAQVACGSDGLIAGFHVKPLELPTP